MPSATIDKPTATPPAAATNNDDENTDYAHLADAYKEPLYICLSRDDPTPAMKQAYASQKLSRQIYTAARKDREEYELNTSSDNWDSCTTRYP